MAAAASVTTRAGWDRRAWTVAFWLCGVVAVLESPTLVAPLKLKLSESASDLMLAVSFLLALFVFPPILSGTARRLTLLWAYVPMVGFFVWLFALAIVGSFLDWIPDSGGDISVTGPIAWSDVVIPLGVLVGGPLISAGPVCLYRYLRRRARVKDAADAAALHQAMYTPRDDVWPPPPTDQGPLL